MKPIERGEVLGLADYETVRPHFRARVIDEKKHRRIAVGPRMTALFENRDSALLQIQEMLRTERITREAAILHEIETYNELVPGPDELSCTMMIEIDDKPEREAFLVAATGLEQAVSFVVDGTKYSGRTTPERVLPDRASAVIYLKLPLGTAGAAALREAARNPTAHTVELSVDHAAYRAAAKLGPALVASLVEDLEG